jgi:hypothetical protein
MHPIRLRGPWDFQVLGPGDGSSPAETPSGRLHMPCDWAATLGASFRGRVMYQRHFGRPTGLEAGDRVDLVIDSVHTHATLRLNGQPIGRPFSAQGTRIDVTTALAERNLLEIVVEHLAGDEPGGLTGEVRLEIFPLQEN